jgi:hypothetical protein
MRVLVVTRHHAPSDSEFGKIFLKICVEPLTFTAKFVTISYVIR